MPDSYIVFICTFDPYGKGLHKYEFRELCLQDTSIELGSGTSKVFINARSKRKDMSEDMRAFLDYLCGNAASSDLTKRIDDGVAQVKAFKPWEAEYMQLYDMMSLVEQDARRIALAEGREEGREIGREEGREEGEARIVQMNEYLIEKERYEDLKRASSDKEYRELILAEMESAQ